MTLDEFRNLAFEGIASIGSRFDEADDDWMPTLFLEDKAGRLTVVGLDGRFLDGAKTKDLLATIILPALVMQIGAIRVAFATSSWISVVAPDEEKRAAALGAGELMPSRDPLAMEALALTIVTPDQIELWTARILRSLEEPPTLEEWKRGEQPHGRFIGPLQEALRQI